MLGGDGVLGKALTASLDRLGIVTREPADGEKYKGLVFDATGITTTDDLARLQRFFTPLMRSLATCARAVVLGRPPELVKGEERIAQRALEGFTRSLGKEIGRGGTAQPCTSPPEPKAPSTRPWRSCSRRSRPTLRSGRPDRGDREQEGGGGQGLGATTCRQDRNVTGASRGIGEQIARVLHRDGATVLGIDVPQAASELQTLMTELNGDSLTLDITHSDAPQRITHHVRTKHDGVDIVVHNAGITRDRKLANMAEDRWNPVIAVNLTAPERITRSLLEADAINRNGRIIGVASIAGIAGNVGQTNYATSKAGVIGLVGAFAAELKNGITVNAVAPGFIETRMTAAVPFAMREIGRRLNAMSQGGLPIDVAETIAWFANPGSTAVNGNVVRVCGLMMLGA